MSKQKIKFTQQLWQSVQHIYKTIIDLPFNRELTAGVLPREKFIYYVQQDALYIQSYTRALALLAAKAPTSDIARDLLSYAKDGIVIEQQLHDYFFNNFSIVPAHEQQPACFAYTNFLLATTAIEPFEIGLAALLPCFWIYREIGFHIAGTSVQNNPYQLWIETYTDENYDRIVDRMIEITDNVAANTSETLRAKMVHVFYQSTRLELNFWQTAYNLEKWPL